MSPQPNQKLLTCRNSSPRSTVLVLIAAMALAFFLLPTEAYGQTDAEQIEDAEAGEAEETQDSDTEVTRRKYNDLSEILKLIDAERFEVAQKKIRRARLLYANDPDDTATEKLREIKQAIFGKEVIVGTKIDEDPVTSRTEGPATGPEKTGNSQPTNDERAQRSKNSKKVLKPDHAEIREIPSVDNRPLAKVTLNACESQQFSGRYFRRPRLLQEV